MHELIDSYEFQLYESYIDIIEERLELFNEAYVDAKKKAKTDKSNNRSALAGGLKAYDGVTTVGAEVIKLQSNIFKIITDTVSRLAKLLGKLIHLVSINLVKFIDTLKRIPGKVKAKIAGNIELYITVEDVPILNTVVQREVNQFFNALDKYLSTKDTKYNINMLFMKNSVDMKLITQLESSYNKLKNIRFEKSIIDLSNRVTAGVYLNPDSNYYKGIIETYQWLDRDELKDQIKKYQIDLSDKEEYNKMKDNYAKMTEEDRKRISNVANMISKILSVIANINRYIAHDINRINTILNSAVDRNESKLDKEFTHISDKLNK